MLHVQHTYPCKNIWPCIHSSFLNCFHYKPMTCEMDDYTARAYRGIFPHQVMWKRVIHCCLPLFTCSVYVHVVTFRLNPIFTSKALLVEELSTSLSLVLIIPQVSGAGCKGRLAISSVSGKYQHLLGCHGGNFFFSIFLLLHLGLYISFILIDGEKMNKSQDLFFRAYLIESETFYPSIYCLEKSNQTNIIWFGLLRLC